MKSTLLKIQYGWILITAILLILILFVSWKHSENNSGNKCWNDIDFKKTERMLLETPIKEKIPFYEYYKNQEVLKGKTKEEIEKNSFYVKRKRRHEYSPIFVLFYHNSLKAVFKTKLYNQKKPYSVYSAVSAYNISQVLNLKIVPPTVIRKIDGKEGVVQLFVENISENKEKNLDNLSPIQKSNIYIFFFLTGITDVQYDNVLISTKCLKPVLVDNDGMVLMHAQYGKYPPFKMLRLKGYPFLDEEDYKNVPFEKAVELKNLSFTDAGKDFFKS